MENYKKGKNVEETLERGKIPIPNLPADFLWMQVRGGSKICNLLTHALKEFPDLKCVVWTGFGQSVGKAITCAEIMKRELGNSLHQVTKLCYRLCEEFWDPVLPELDQLVVKRKLPMIHILLSVEDLNFSQELGYQGPGEIVKCLSSGKKKDTNSSRDKTTNGNKNKKRRNKFYGNKSNSSETKNR